MARVSIALQKRGFCVSTPNTRKRIDWDRLIDELLDLSNVHEVDGPLINGCMGVTYDDDDRPDTVLIAELQAVFSRFF